MKKPIWLVLLLSAISFAGVLLLGRKKVSPAVDQNCIDCGKPAEAQDSGVSQFCESCRKKRTDAAITRRMLELGINPNADGIKYHLRFHYELLMALLFPSVTVLILMAGLSFIRQTFGRAGVTELGQATTTLLNNMTEVGFWIIIPGFFVIIIVGVISKLRMNMLWQASLGSLMLLSPFAILSPAMLTSWTWTPGNTLRALASCLLVLIGILLVFFELEPDRRTFNPRSPEDAIDAARGL